jgi:L-threonylcarbamoyladenylate synthase
MQVFNAASLSDDDFNQILSFLRSGGVIGFPTDTAYGLAADASNEDAVRRIFEIKGRSENKPILLIVDSIDMASRVARISETAQRLAAKLWPGPLTMVLPATPDVSATLTAGTNTIGVRWPDAPFATRLISALGKPITATSANQSGMPAAATADEVRVQLEGQLDMLVDGGTLPVPGGSTVLDLTCEPPVVLREGPVSFQRLHELLGGNVQRSETESRK